MKMTLSMLRIGLLASALVIAAEDQTVQLQLAESPVDLPTGKDI